MSQTPPATPGPAITRKLAETPADDVTRATGFGARCASEVRQSRTGELKSGDAVYPDAQDADDAWLRQHGGDSINAFAARATQASRRMAWNHDYHHRMSQRGF